QMRSHCSAIPVLCPLYTLTAVRASSFLFLMIPPPPRSTLFPYTTLFRSGVAQPGSALRSGRRGPQFKSGHPDKNGGTPGFPRWPDRKSTRLNSSHVAISYAVFCLKKKKNAEHHPVQGIRAPPCAAIVDAI